MCHMPEISRAETVLPLLARAKVDRLLEYAEAWSGLTKQPELDVADSIVSRRDAISVDSVYHPACWNRFTSASKLDRTRSSKTATTRKRVSLCESVTELSACSFSQI